MLLSISIGTSLGHRETGPPHPEDARPRVVAWLRHRAADRATVRRRLGALYPALQRLEKDGLIDAEWKASDNNRRARYYRLTAAGRRRLAAEMEDWERVSAAVTRILKAT